MNIPIEIINLILSYMPKKRCFRCEKTISLIDNPVIYNNLDFCSTYCIDYTHY